MRKLSSKSGDDQPVDLSVSKVILGFLKHADEYYRENDRPTGEGSNIMLTMRLLKKQYGHTLANALGPLALKAVRQAMIDSELCRNVVNRRTRYVVRVFGWTVEQELIPPSVHHGLKAVQSLRKHRSAARESGPVKPVPDQFVDALQPHVVRQIWAMIQLQRLTGMRPGEVCMMRTIDLETSGRIWIYRPSEHKAEHHDKNRVIYLGPKAQAVLKPWLKADLKAILFSPRDTAEEHWVARRLARKTPMTPSQRARARKLTPSGCRASRTTRRHTGVRSSTAASWQTCPSGTRTSSGTTPPPSCGRNFASTSHGQSSATRRPPRRKSTQRSTRPRPGPRWSGSSDVEAPVDTMSK